MPKIVDHDERRERIALAACRAIGRFGFERVTLVQIAREAGFTTGMVTHYFPNKQAVLVAALRSILNRVHRRLERRMESEDVDLLDLISEFLPTDQDRRAETAAWVAFWGAVAVDPEMDAVNREVHEEASRLFEQSLRAGWPETGSWTEERLNATRQSLQIFVNGIAASATTSPKSWPESLQRKLINRHLRQIRYNDA